MAFLQEVKKKKRIVGVGRGGRGGGDGVLEDIIYQFANRLESVNGGRKRTFRLSRANAPPSCDVISFSTRFPSFGPSSSAAAAQRGEQREEANSNSDRKLPTLPP